ncbi:hypothetical protein [Pararhodobacter zhoushanensis]|uniref:Uncharacterized protein n=1 Tax=Pararhodobacter zhoushanensis TaxID=2479545 RepID=A0ABT3H306_9RHOB|nr:hypothetical protein [Pararhodobacter zhoushanensis]MCW1934164.1 hypothetical protein [Pararhodobacter zhoushanensis]
MIRGLSQRLPMDRQAYGRDAEGRAARAAEGVQAVLVFPQEFSHCLPGSEPALLTLIRSGGLTMAESPVTGALPGILEPAQPRRCRWSGRPW